MKCGPIRASTRGRWRAVTLISIHLLVAAHVLHWSIAGTTLTPMEPSEAMQTLGQGLVNAGFVLFALTIVSTAIFGRFFCGWGCHIVALQDLCTWILRKLRVPQRPFRSRLLVFVPLLAAIYMFVLPSLVRLGRGAPFPGLQAHFETEDFWGRFPDWEIALLTFLVCGFVIVYVLGNKGFCTYACPYGGIFGLVNRVAPGKIRVTDACDGCGHCTATCTSNVRVHEEVRDYGKVVDPGCMKTTDCVSVCPMNALYYGFTSRASDAAPATAPPEPAAVPRATTGSTSGAAAPETAPLRRRRPGPSRSSRRHDFTWPEEIAMAGIFLVSIVIFRALYDAVPLLLALGLSSITAYVVMTLWRMRTQANLAFGKRQLRRNGVTTRVGRMFALVAGAWTLFVVHSGVVQFYTLDGGRRLASARAHVDAAGTRDLVATDRLEDARRRLVRAEALGIFPSPQLLARIASASSYLGDHIDAERHYARAAEMAPDFAHAHVELARYAAQREAWNEAIRQLVAAVRHEPELPGAHEDLVALLIEQGRPAEASERLDELIERRPRHLPFRLTRVLFMAQSGEADDALVEMRHILERWPDEATAHVTHGRVLASMDRYDDALVAFDRALTIAPAYAEAHYIAAQVAMRIERWDDVERHLDAARRLDPRDSRYTSAWARFEAARGRAAVRAEPAPPSSP